jgi:tetratricopeptide (TPR) repeat protein
LAVLFIAFSLLGGYEQLRFGLAVQRDDMEEARSAAERLDSIGRGSPGFFALSANAAFASGDREGALRAYQASVDFYPTSAGWLGVGLVSYDLGRIPQAERAYERAIAFDPANAEAQRRYGLVLLATGRAAGAVDALTHARLLRPDDAEIARELDRARAALAREQAP